MVAGVCTLLMRPCRLVRSAIVLLFSSTVPRKPGPKGLCMANCLSDCRSSYQGFPSGLGEYAFRRSVLVRVLVPDAANASGFESFRFLDSTLI
jgi:hypothetical protein